MRLSRRRFVAGCAGLASARTLGQFAVGGTATTTRLDLAKIDRERILAAAGTALGRTVQPSLDAASEAFLQMTLDVPALAAAVQIDAANEQKYAGRAAETLAAWFGKAGQKSGLRLEISGWEDLLHFAQLAEVAVALSFLPVSEEIRAGTVTWLRRYLEFLTTSEEAGLARDAKDRHGSSWLLQVAAFARLCGDEAQVEAARKLYRHATLRAELNAEGFFVHELRTANPLRNSLMNLDLLGGVCQLLSTRFESFWDVELQDGPGMRAAVARHAPYCAKPASWPYPADAEHFGQLPGRRPTLAFAARAYAQPEYAELFLKLSGPGTLPQDADLLRALPIRQPLLWVAQPRRRVAD